MHASLAAASLSHCALHWHNGRACAASCAQPHAVLWSLIRFALVATMFLVIHKLRCSTDTMDAVCLRFCHCSSAPYSASSPIFLNVWSAIPALLVEQLLLGGMKIMCHATLMMQDAESNWQFDIFALAKETPGYTLSLLAVHLHKVTGFMDGLDEPRFTNYVRAIESGYLSTNPYHNRCSMQSLWVMSSEGYCKSSV